MDISQRLCVRAEFNVILNHRRRPICYAIADCHTLAERAVAANNCARMNKNISEMIYTQSWPDLRFQRQANAGDCFNDAKDHPVKFQLNISYRPRLVVQHAAPEAINEDCPDRLLLKERSSRVACEIGSEIGIACHRATYLLIFFALSARPSVLSMLEALINVG